MVGDTLANAAATDQARKAQVDNAHRAAQSQFAQMDMNRELTRAQNITNAAQQASNALIGAGAALEGSVDLTGGKNKSKDLGQMMADQQTKLMEDLSNPAYDAPLRRTL